MDTKTVEKALRETRAVVTVEEHSTRGGLGEAVSHIAAELRGSAPMRLLGLPGGGCNRKTSGVVRLLWSDPRRD